MAVRLPSDLIADVMRNADPVRRSAAAEKLRSAGESAGTRFALSVEDVKPPTTSTTRHPNEPLPAAPAGLSPGSGSRAAAYQGFERVVLRNLFEALLPSEESGSFGEGPSAGVWRSMAADQLAGVYSEGGGIGIAKLMDNHASTLRREAQWPYFSKDTISTFKA